VKIIKNILIYGLFLALVFVYGDKFADLPYVILLATISFLVVSLLIKGNSIGYRYDFSTSKFGMLDKNLSLILTWLWLLIFISWLIGVMIGLINGAKPNLAFRNFFGLVVYLLIPFMFIVQPSLKSVITMLYFAGVFQICYSLLNSYTIINPFAYHVESSLSEMRNFSSIGGIILFPLFLVGLACKILPKKFMPYDYGNVVNKLSDNYIFTFLSLYALIVPVFSKGFVLATIILFIFIFLLAFYYSISAMALRKNLIILFILLVAILCALPPSFYNILAHSFSSQEVSNATRAEQYDYLVNEFSLLGSGLGSILRSGYVRDYDCGYGFELTYINLIHKLGIFSMFLFSSYIITIVIPIVRVFNKVYVFESLFGLGLMGYLIVGAGNPLLLSVPGVIVHSVAIYLIVKPFLRPILPYEYATK